MWLWLLAVLTFLFWYFVIKDDDNPLDKLPGPPRLPVVGCAIELLKIKQDELFLAMQKFSDLYGERYIFKVFNKRILHLNNPADAEVVLSHTRNIRKSTPYNFLRPWLGNGLLVNSGQSWHKRRKTLTPTFHFNVLKNFAVVIEENSQKLVKKLKATDKKEIDMVPIIFNTTLSIICETAMGTQLDRSESQAVADYKNAILNMTSTVIKRLTTVWLQSDLIFWNLPIGRRFRESQQIAAQFADKVINERKKRRQQNDSSLVESEDLGIKKRLAMLDLLLEAEAKGEIDNEGIHDEVNTFMVAGHDTTAIALILGLVLIADHKDVQERIYEEIMNVVGDSEVSVSHLAELKYLEAVIKETMRLYPSAPFIGRKVEEDFMLGDLPVKKGMELSLHIYQVHRRKDLYTDPMAFKPERFLDGHMKHTYAFIPFSAGLRNCIGQKFAMLEMKTILLEICRNFTVVLKQPGWRPKLAAEIILRPTEPVYLQFIPRTANV